jgi:hypothetical protein
MAGRTSPPPPKQPAHLSEGGMRSALPKLQRRLDEVKTVDPEQATGAYMPEFEAINKNVNATLTDIFGHDSIDYDRYKSSSLYRYTLRRWNTST